MSEVKMASLTMYRIVLEHEYNEMIELMTECKAGLPPKNVLRKAAFISALHQLRIQNPT